jgi:shikimate kinase
MKDEQRAAYRVPDDKCVVIIGMAGAGKTTMGRELAKMLDWLFMDTDSLIESAYGTRLQNVTDGMTKDEFLDMEAASIRKIRAQRCIIATGGSVVYREEAMNHLRVLGPILYTDVALPVILERIARKPDRGLAIGPGQTIEDLFNERKALYEKFATVKIYGGEEHCLVYARKAMEILENYFSRG